MLRAFSKPAGQRLAMETEINSYRRAYCRPRLLDLLNLLIKQYFVSPLICSNLAALVGYFLLFIIILCIFGRISHLPLHLKSRVNKFFVYDKKK